MVENCIQHGIRESNRFCCIRIRIRAARDQLKISVVDNGIGMGADKLREIRNRMSDDCEPSEHIGLYNTYKHLRLMYGEEFTMKIISKANHGTAVYISIPITD